jgi:hypothetical protein
MHGAELRLTCASTGAGNRTVRLQDAEDLVTSDNYSMLARAQKCSEYARLTLDLGDTVRVTEDLTNPAVPSVFIVGFQLRGILTAREWRPSLRACQSAQRPARGWSTTTPGGCGSRGWPRLKCPFRCCEDDPFSRICTSGDLVD